MGYFADLLSKSNAAVEPGPETLGDSLRKGWSSGVDTMGADVNQIVGLGAEAMGADNFAQGRYRAAQGLREEAQHNAPQVNSLGQVDGVGNALRWGVGQIGAMGPTALGVVGGTVATGNPFVGGALAMGLPEAGDIAHRQTLDPQTMEQGAGTRLTKALAGGAASGAVQAAGPGLLMGKVAKGAGAGLVKQSTGQIIGRNFAEGVGVNAAAEGGSEAIKQFAANPDASFNMGAIGESALAGGVLGVPFGALGAGVDVAKASPGKAWIGAKNTAQQGVENARSAVESAGEALAPTWEAVKGHVDAGMTAAQTGAKDAWAAMPEGLKGVGEFVKTGVEDQIASARTAYKNIMSDANVPDALKAQAQEWGGNLANTANRAYLWSADKMRGVGEKAKAAVPEDVVGRLREFSKPAGDMLDTILNSESMADTREFTGKTLDQAKEMLKGRKEQATKWLGPKMDELMDRADVSDERKQQIADLRNNIGDSAAQAKAATILKAQKLADAAKPKLDAAYKKVGDAFSKLFPEDPNVKKSDDHSGMNALIFDKIGPMIKEAKPELLEDADSTMKLGSMLRMFMKAAAEGKDLRVAGIHTEMVDLLGPDLAHDVLNAAHEFATGGDQTKQANYFKHLTDSVKEKASMDNLETVITKSLSNEASGRTGVTDNPRELAKYLRGWARGDYAVGKPKERVEFEDQEVQKFLETHFGTNAQKIRDALQKDVEGERGKQKAGIGEEGGMDFDSTGEYDTNITYHGVKEVGDTPKLYESDRSVKNNGGGGQYGSAVEQAIKKLKAEHPDMNVSFVKLTDYAKAHNLNEEQIARLAEGKDPSQHGFIKKERIKNDDGLEEYQLRAMRGKIKSDKHPDAIGVEGRSENYAYDSRRIANVMHLGAKGEWSKFENDAGMHGRLAQKFAEGIAKLTAHEGHNLKVRDDHVIAVLDGKDFTWGEAQKLLGQRDETEVPKHLKDVSANEMKLHDAVSGLNDQELQKSLGQFTDARDAKMEGVAESIRAATRSEMGFAAKGSNKAAQIERTVRERISAHMKDEATKIPPLERIIRSIENELAKRSGEDQRSEVMDTGMETRQGLALGKVKQREAEGKAARAADRADKLHAAGDTESFGTLTKFLGGIDPREELQRAQLEAADASQGRGDVGQDTGIGSGRTHGDREGQIHDAAATVGQKGMERNTQGLNGEPANARPVMLRAAEVRRSDSTMKNVVADRLMALAKNMQMMSGRDQAELTRAVSLSSIVDLKNAIDPIARKYADRIVAPGKKDTSLAESRELLTRLSEINYRLENPEALDTRTYLKQLDSQRMALELQIAKLEGKDAKGTIGKNPVRFDRYGKALESEPAKTTESLKATLDKHADYIDNPPEDFSVERAKTIADWAERQEARLKEAKAKLEEKGGDEFERLEGMYFDARLLKERAREVIKSEADATEMGLREGDTPSKKTSTAERFIDAARTEVAETAALAEALTAFRKGTATKAQTAMVDEAFKDAHTRVGAGEDAPPMFNHGEGTPDPKPVAAKKAAFLERAASGDKALIKELSTSDDAKGLQRAVEALYGVVGADDALQAANKRLGELVQDPSTALAMQGKKYSLDATAATSASPLTAKGRAQILAYLNTVAPWAQAEFPFLSHAGEFTKEFGQAIVRVSTHALNPTSVAYHESLHAFFQHLKENSGKDISQVVMDAASSPAVTSQLRKLLAHSPEALKQLGNAEERAAYMYQFWADGKLALAEKPTTLFQKITAAFRKVLGIWSNDERALHIMEYFHSGEYAQNVGKQSAVRTALMEKGHNTAVDTLREMGGKFMEVGDALWGAGSARLRDSKSGALHELADLMKRKGTDVGEDRGYIPAARLKRTEFITQMAEGLAGADETVMHEALEALQGGTKPTSLEARKAYASVRKVLDDMFDYLHQSGVDTGDLGYGKDYFPRHWDSNYLSKHEAEFMDMARKYPQWADAKDTYNKLLANDGSELRVADRPGMQANKRRVLSFIKDADAAPFMSKNLPEIMNGYITQATRRGEWARRFGDDNVRMGELLDRARKEGASKAEIAHAQDFVAGVNGTLGDTLNPTLRRYMGNMIVYQNIRLLPLAIFSSVVDPMGVMVRGGTVGDAWSTFKRGIREVPAGLKGREITDYWTGMAQALGTIDNASLQHALGSLYTQGMVGGTAKKINDTFFKYNLMEQFNQSMRVGATEAAVGFITKHADGKASQHSIRWIAELGLRGGDVKVSNGRMATTVAEGLTEAQAARVKSAVNQWVDGAVLRPDAADKPTWMNDPHFMLISHLKQFVYSFHHTILDRVMHETKHQNYAPAIALSSYVPIMIAADMLKGLIQGGGEEPSWKKAWGPGEYLENGVERAGLFGVGQFGVDALQGNFGSLAGPTLGQFADGFEVLDGVKQFKTFAIHSLPANQLYAGALRAGEPDPVFTE